MNIKQKVASLGPVLLYAGAAIGVSHLVQSTKSGALYGAILIIAIIVVNLVKYPFFEAGSRYAAATGNSLIAGYKKIGKWAVVLISLVSVWSEIPNSLIGVCFCVEKSLKVLVI